MIRHGMFQNFAIMLLQIWCGWLPTKCDICWVLKSTRIKVNNEYYKSYDEPGLRENSFLKSKSSLRYAKIVSRLRHRKSYLHFRFVGFKWTSSLAEDSKTFTDPVVSKWTTQRGSWKRESRSSCIHDHNSNASQVLCPYCFKWTMKVFYELLSQYVWYQKESDPFFCLPINRQ